MAQQVLAIGLDGYELSLEEELIAQGELPHLARLREESARFLLDHGPAQRTGLAWEQVSAARAPQDCGRWAAVTFDPDTYEAYQEGALFAPWEGYSAVRTVVFDTPYFELSRAPKVRGLVNWGAHDPGVATGARPESLLHEFETRFGRYPAREWIYGVAWQSQERCRRMGEALTAAVDVRSRAARWLFQEQMPDWDLALMVVSEPHSAIEGLWHGIDPDHPLAGHPSAPVAGEGARQLYRALDRLAGNLREAFPEAALAVFSMGGMGSNASDVASMVLLPELLYRKAFGRPLLRLRPAWTADPAAVPLLAEEENWHHVLREALPAELPGRQPAAQRLLARVLRKVVGRPRRQARMPLEWMPAARYQPHWPSMPLFALPSFYDGRLRVNLAGRESRGMIAPERYEATLDEVEATLRASVNPATGESVVQEVERPGRDRDPRELGPTEADMVVIWKATLAFQHPDYGCVGPVPYRRTGGHTGPHGMAYLRGPGVAPGAAGVRSSFDVVPTLLRLAGASPSGGFSGRSLLEVG